MTMQPLKCPNCGSPSVQPLQDGNKYHCPSCGGNSILNPETQVLILLSAAVSCPECGRLNDTSAKYCGACGSPLVFPCPFCWRVHQPGERYCPSCGELMRGVPETSPENVIAAVERNFQRWDGKASLFPRISSSIGVAKDLKSLLKAGEIAMWSFTPPRNEQSRRNVYGYLLFVFDNNRFLRDGLFVATSSRFLYYMPAIPPKKGWFSSRPGSPSFHIAYPYSEVVGIRYDSKLPVSKESLNAIVSEYPASYDPPVSRVARASTSPGWEISFKGGRFLRFQSLPNGWFDMKQLRFWESVLRITLGVARSDLDYIPHPTPR
ncbi:MAG: hypothetical protein DRP09_18670 [Candidatus Thorarchaeota archaeon]|nr:MAG: hypothetical protein DRP09_18670 [Candidatus Thorarchaeota archaeon]